MALSVEHHQGAIMVSDPSGRSVIITEDDSIGGMIVTFPEGAITSGMTPFMFAFEDDLFEQCTERFHLVVRKAPPTNFKHIQEGCHGCPD